MQTLFNVKNKIREVIRKYQEIIFPILRLIWCYLVFSNVHTMFHYMDLFDRKGERYTYAAWSGSGDGAFRPAGKV